ncbi:hypothetical protein AGMMS49957_10420 [Synergistales bacterium]|nr:hypothetical protein AGMMS49957_10420 [Synergistales bacterium]
MADETKVIIVNKGSTTEWANQVRPLEAGELGYNTDTKKTAVGDDSSSFETLPKLLDSNDIATNTAAGVVKGSTDAWKASAGVDGTLSVNTVDASATAKGLTQYATPAEISQVTPPSNKVVTADMLAKSRRPNIVINQEFETGYLRGGRVEYGYLWDFGTVSNGRVTKVMPVLALGAIPDQIIVDTSRSHLFSPPVWIISIPFNAEGQIVSMTINRDTTPYTLSVGVLGLAGNVTICLLYTKINDPVLV